MGMQIDERRFKTRAEADADQADRGDRNYCERYGRGVTELTLSDGSTAYVSKVQVYYG